MSTQLKRKGDQLHTGSLEANAGGLGGISLADLISRRNHVELDHLCWVFILSKRCPFNSSEQNAEYVLID